LFGKNIDWQSPSSSPYGGDAGSPVRIPEKVAFGKEYMPLVSEWMQTKYCNRKG